MILVLIPLTLPSPRWEEGERIALVAALPSGRDVYVAGRERQRAGEGAIQHDFIAL